MKDYSDVWLIQRLEKPSRPTELPTNPFSFGCVPNGGLSKAALEILTGVWRFDYMGAAEYEFGDVPKALNALATKKLEAVTLEIPYSKLKKPSVYWKDPPLPELKGKFSIYIVCPEGDAEKVKEVVTLLAQDKQKIRDDTHLNLAIYKRPYIDAVGWLALDPPFMFFIDEEMFLKVKKLFVDKEASDATTG